MQKITFAKAFGILIFFEKMFFSRMMSSRWNRSERSRTLTLNFRKILQSLKMDKKSTYYLCGFRTTLWFPKLFQMIDIMFFQGVAVTLFFNFATYTLYFWNKFFRGLTLDSFDFDFVTYSMSSFISSNKKFLN